MVKIIQNLWPLLLPLVGIAVVGIFYRWYLVRMERRVFSHGVTVLAQVVDVRIDEGDCIVEYSFADPKTGKQFTRSGVIGFQMKNPPIEGESIPVRYLPDKPSWSRMVGEIHLASS